LNFTIKEEFKVPYNDFREWIKKIEDEGELLRIKDEVRLEPDIGAAAQASVLTNGPGLFFERLLGYPPTHTLTIALMGSIRRLALSLELPKSTTRAELVKELARRLENKVIKPKRVNSAPLKEERHFGKEVNLFEFPLHRLNMCDGGPYLTKTHIITKDPETGWVNVGMYRMQVKDKAKTNVWFTMGQHGGMIYRKWEDMGKPMPMAVAFGVDPALTWVAVSRFNVGVNEYDVAGAIRGEPLEVIPAETVDLDVPASAEIVIEGEVPPGVREFEGPFGEYPGAYSSYHKIMIFEVKAITHRRNPIFDAIHIGKVPNENSVIFSVSRPAVDTKYMKELFPEIIAVVPYPGSHQVVIQGKFRRHGDARRVMLGWFSGPFKDLAKNCIVVDEDIDPYDPEQVLWALSYRFQADRDLVIIPNYSSVGFDPSETHDGLVTLCGFDATKPKPPFPRYEMVAWVEPWKETEEWKKKIAKDWLKKEEEL